MMACSASVPSWWCRGRWFPISRNRGSLCFAALGGGDRANGSKRNEEDKEGWMKAPEAPKTDHYSVLGISRDASPSAVKVAFRKLARKVWQDNQSIPILSLHVTILLSVSTNLSRKKSWALLKHLNIKSAPMGFKIII